MKLARLIAAVDPTVGGVLVFGDRGTGKSTAVRALASLLPFMQTIANCRPGCDPAEERAWCEDCRARAETGKLKTATSPVPVVDLPLGVIEDHVISALDMERALTKSEMLDRFGLSVEVRTPGDLPTRTDVVRRRDAFERDPSGFLEKWAKEDAQTRRRIFAARDLLPTVEMPDSVLGRAVVELFGA